ncbi:hypothetical protein VTK56DRAFT_1378 [Thermocarpiscus australiensis]
MSGRSSSLHLDTEFGRFETPVSVNTPSANSRRGPAPSAPALACMQGPSAGSARRCGNNSGTVSTSKPQQRSCMFLTLSSATEKMQTVSRELRRGGVPGASAH